MTHADFLFGVVEGFYGVFYTFPERRDLIRFLGQHGYNSYVYGPKNDRQHRARWWEAYPPRIMEEFRQTVEVARQVGIDFCYAISPGGTMCYCDPADFEKLTSKLQAFLNIGVRAFCLALDDNQPGFRHTQDADFYPDLPSAQADLANRLYRWLKERDPGCTLNMVPADYNGRAPFSPNLIKLGQMLHPNIALCYTGSDICSPEIPTKDATDYLQAVGRKPLLFDNYPVNDLAMQPELHIGPILGRSPDLPVALSGILVNPMSAAEASRIPLATYAAYLADPRGYSTERAWQSALEEVAGPDYAAPVRLLAEITDHSCLARHGQPLECLANNALAALKLATGQPVTAHPAIQALEQYLTEMDEAGYTLKFRQENLALRQDLLPWIEIMEHWMWITRFALRVLHNLENGLDYLADLNRVQEYHQAICTHPKRIATDALLPLVEDILDRAARDQQQRQIAIQAGSCQTVN